MDNNQFVKIVDEIDRLRKATEEADNSFDIRQLGDKLDDIKAVLIEIRDRLPERG